MNKKRVAIFSFLVFGIILSAVLVFAVPDTTMVVKGFQDFFAPLLNALFGADNAANIFELLLFALIIVAVCYMALERVDVIRSNSFALWTITIVVAILSVRYIGTMGAVKALLFPQGVFGVALLAFFPFVLFFWFIEFGLTGAGSRVLRKIGWAVYAAVFAFLWYKQFVVSTKNAVSVDQWGYLYLIAAGLAIILLLADGTIQRAIAKSKSINHLEEIKEREISRIKRKMEKAEDELAEPAKSKEIRRLKRELDDILKKYS